MPQTKQLFLDCDNTLVFSEDLAFEACADLTNDILAEQGINDRYTGEQLIVDFVGQNFRGIMKAIQDKYNFKIAPEKIDHYVKQEENAVVAKFSNKIRACDGSLEVLEKLHKEKAYGLAVVSSSALRRIRVCLENSGHDKFVAHEHVYSAVNSLEKPTSKPDPAVYLHAMNDIGVGPEECITVEDSKSGAVAAVRAKIACIGYVGAYHTRGKQDQVAKTLTELGCKVIMYHWSEFFDCVGKLERS